MLKYLFNSDFLSILLSNCVLFDVYSLRTTIHCPEIGGGFCTYKMPVIHKPEK
jgi:hypothetical protein